MHLTNARYAGPLYRALNPVYAREPLSGRGAELYGGRFNAKGVAALYTALDPAGALRESNQAGSLQPTILVSYQADLDPIFDSRSVQSGDVGGLPCRSWLAGKDAWRAAGSYAGLLHQAYHRWFVGMLVRSFAKGATADDFNIVLWRWIGAGCGLAVVDNENRLLRL